RAGLPDLSRAPEDEPSGRARDDLRGILPRASVGALRRQQGTVAGLLLTATSPTDSVVQVTRAARPSQAPAGPPRASVGALPPAQLGIPPPQDPCPPPQRDNPRSSAPPSAAPLHTARGRSTCRRR